MAYRLYIPKKRTDRRPATPPHPFSAPRVCPGIFRSTSRSRYGTAAPSSSTPREIWRFHVGTPRSRSAPVPGVVGPGNARRTCAPTTRSTGCSFLAPPHPSEHQCSHQATWGPDPAARSSVTPVDAYYISTMIPSYASRKDLLFVEVKPYTMISLTHIMGRGAPLQKYA